MLTTLLLSFLGVFVINITAYLIAYKKQTDHLTDITYNLSFLLLSGTLWIYFADYSLFKNLLLAMIVIWSIRLGIFLLYRINKMGKDARFDDFRKSPHGFLKFWILQSVSIWIIALPFIYGFSQGSPKLGLISWIGFAMWGLGLIIETIADWQKFSFRENKANEGQFIKSGLFSFLRHPNYTGEIMCWVGVFIYLIPLFQGIAWMSIISPLWIITLLVFISGIPLLEKAHKKKYGHLDSYKQYVNKSWRLFAYIY